MRLRKTCARSLAVVGRRGDPRPSRSGPSAIEVDVARVARGPMQVTIDEEGETRVRERFVVSAPVAGRVRAHRARAGRSRGARQDLVARLTPAAAPLIDPRTQAELAPPSRRPARRSDRHRPSASARPRCWRARAVDAAAAGGAGRSGRDLAATSSKPRRRRCRTRRGSAARGGVRRRARGARAAAGARPAAGLRAAGGGRSTSSRRSTAWC